VNPADAERLGMADGEMIRVTSRRGSITTRIVITERVPVGTMFMTFHYKESPVNELTNAAGDPVTMTAEFKVCAVRMDKEPQAEQTLTPAEHRGAAAK
jgi:predicted molibdopterin-dependent oxidoreductase YjgC